MPARLTERAARIVSKPRTAWATWPNGRRVVHIGDPLYGPVKTLVLGRCQHGSSLSTSSSKRKNAARKRAHASRRRNRGT